MNYEDGEVIGLDTDGNLIQWDAEKKAAYNSGVTPEDFGIENLHPRELARITQ